MATEQREISAERREHVVNEVEWLLAGGTWPSNIPSRLGYTASGLERFLRRAGRNDLARKFDRGQE